MALFFYGTLMDPSIPTEILEVEEASLLRYVILINYCKL